MGTNYYWCEERYDTCSQCGHKKKLDNIERHIGKSSVGWTFALHVYPEEGIHSLEAWIHLWSTGKGCIRDEYGAGISIVRMLDYIMCRYSTGTIQSEGWYQQNYAKPGPRGLARRIGKDIIGYGEDEGTWDYCVGDFS